AELDAAASTAGDGPDPATAGPLAGGDPAAATPALPAADVPGLGAEIAARLGDALANRTDVQSILDEVDKRLGGGGSEEGYGLGSVLPSDDEPLPAGGGFDGDLRPLIEEYLWEADAERADEPILDELVRVQLENPVPRLDLEALE